MSVNRKLFVVMSAILAVVVSTFGAVTTARKTKRLSTAEHWLHLLSGAKQNHPVQKRAVKADRPAEIIGKTGYQLYRD